MSYCLPVWGTASKVYMNTLQILQNKFLKYMLFKTNLTPSKELYTEKFLSLNQMSAYESILLIYKIANGLMKCNFPLTLVYSTTKINTRNSSNFIIPNFTMAKAQKSLFNRGLDLYNKIPIEIKKTENLSLFKKSLKKYVSRNFQIK